MQRFCSTYAQPLAVNRYIAFKKNKHFNNELLYDLPALKQIVSWNRSTIVILLLSSDQQIQHLRYFNVHFLLKRHRSKLRHLNISDYVQTSTFTNTKMRNKIVIILSQNISYTVFFTPMPAVLTKAINSKIMICLLNTEHIKFRIILLVAVTIKGMIVVKFSFPKIVSVVLHFKQIIVIIYSALMKIHIAVQIYIPPCKGHFLVVQILWFINSSSGLTD